MFCIGSVKNYSGDLDLSNAHSLIFDTGFHHSSIRFRKRFAFLPRLLAVILALVLVAGCAGKQAAKNGDDFANEEIADPIEPFNRAMFSFNEFLDTILLRPAAEIYRNVLPEPIRDGIRNFLRNLETPVILANDLLQGEGKRAEKTLHRFLINSTLGIAGILDVAFDMGLSYHDEDFGQTLAVWGVDEGIYLVLPILGPSTTRDAAGRVVDIFLDPLTYVSWNNPDYDYIFYTRRGVRIVDIRSRNIETLDQLKKESLDFYSLIRSIYRQNRNKEIRNGRAEDDDDELPSRKKEKDK